MSAAAKRNLLLTIDVFGTLIKPRTPIIDQYKEEAAKFGVQFNVTNDLDKLMASEFKMAYIQAHQKHPNHGAGEKAIGFEEWWRIVIKKSLEPFIAPGVKIPDGLGPALVKRFSSLEGYDLHHDVIPFLKSISSRIPPWRYPPLVTIPPNGAPPPDMPITICGILSNGDPRISVILESLGIAKYFSFQHLSYNTGFQKPSREAFRNARQTGLRIGKGNPSYTTRNPTSRAELTKKWLGWDFIHVGDDVSHDWCAARKVTDMQPVWLDRAKVGLGHGDSMEKFIKRSTDEYPMQMPHMAEGMKDWGDQLPDDKLWKLLGTLKPKSTGNPTPQELRNELRRSTITNLTELPHLFPHYYIPLETGDDNPVSIALRDPDKWDDELRKLAKRKQQEKRRTLAMVSQEKMKWVEKRNFREQVKKEKEYGNGMKWQAKQERPLTRYVGRNIERGSYSRRYSNGREEISSAERVSQPWKLWRNAKDTGGRGNSSERARATQGKSREFKGESQWDWYRRQ
ncbi:hypothetical protein L211DRAFT_870234 [Terfezia boudieri ATCC MYA-4762]|uniref:HAD-superfamily hydrolase n=1 Tax=Terfezia boudieri ATCC MYA-4762 TaxID=1051890 RepID=A0A3N4LDW6_9PEZI|nr:hypothetical protein L211DRAFT_870234 [Terfezia boudieri ATCC MYA-4762]